MIKAVVFDLDDTLTPEIDYVRSGFRHLSVPLATKLNLSAEKVYTILIELFLEDSRLVFNRLFERVSMPYSNDDIVELVGSYRDHIPAIHFYDDVFPCLKELRDKGVKTGIITDGYATAQRNKLRVLNADQYFDHIIVTDELGKGYWKPHPLAFELMRDRLEVEFYEMVYVGDNPKKDFYIGKVFPITTVRIDRNGLYSDASYLHGVKENISITSLSELLAN